MLATLLLSLAPAVAQDPVGALLDQFVEAGRSPGVSVAIAKPDGSLMAWARGWEDPGSEQKLSTDHYLMSGSIGKTYFAALAAELMEEGRMKPEDRLAQYLGDLDWYARLPNAQTVTIDSLLKHTSGVMDHVRMPEFFAQAEAEPQKQWTRAELMAFLLDEEPLFAVDEGWAYADANYILLGMALEKELGESVYREVWRRYLQPLGLHQTRENNSYDLPGLAQGWHILGTDWQEAKPVIRNGAFYLNPQMEWCGGGYRSTTSDLAKWGAELFAGRAVSAPARQRMLDAAVDAQLYPGDRYGYGVIVASTPAGPAWGHSGWFPGYLSEMMWLPELGVCVAVQVNSDDARKVGPLRALAVEVAKAYTSTTVGGKAK